MKKNLLLILLLVLSYGAFASGIQPGRWQWRSSDGTSAIANVGKPFKLTHINDVVSLRWQFFANSDAAFQGGRLFLQYFDAGPIPGYTDGTTTNFDSLLYGYITQPKTDYRRMEELPNSIFGPSQSTIQNVNNRFSADAYGGYGYHTVGDASTITNVLSQYPKYNGNTIKDPTQAIQIVEDYKNAHPDATDQEVASQFGITLPTIGAATVYSSSASENSSAGAVFIMANPTGTVDDFKKGTTSDFSSSSSIMKLPITSAADNSTGGRSGGDYKTSSGGTPTYSNYYTLRMTNFNGNHAIQDIPATNSSGNIILNLIEFEFQIKLNYIATGPGTYSYRFKPGHRYFFRLRGAGYDNNQSSWGYSSPDAGVDGESTSNYPTVYLNGSSNSNYRTGFFMGISPIPYLDIDPLIIAKTLPVTYATPLSATLNNGKVDLLWKSAVEINNKGYAVLAGIAADNLSQIDYIKTQAPNGNTSVGYTYTSQDKAPTNNAWNYYQLRQEDIDGKTSLSDVAKVYVSGSSNGVTIGPNPIVDQLNIKNIKAGTDIKIISAAGQIVKAAKASSTTYTFENLKSLSSGVYMVVVTNANGKLETHKVMKK